MLKEMTKQVEKERGLLVREKGKWKEEKEEDFEHLLSPLHSIFANKQSLRYFQTAYIFKEEDRTLY